MLVFLSFFVFLILNAQGGSPSIISTTFNTSSPTIEPTPAPTKMPTYHPTLRPTAYPTPLLSSGEGILITVNITMETLSAPNVFGEESFFILAFEGAAGLENKNFTDLTITIEDAFNSTCLSFKIPSATIVFTITTFNPLVLSAVRLALQSGTFETEFESSVQSEFQDASFCANRTTVNYTTEASHVLIPPTTTKTVGQKIVHHGQYLGYGLAFIILAIIWLFMAQVSKIDDKNDVGQGYHYNALEVFAASKSYAVINHNGEEEVVSTTVVATETISGQ